MPPTQPPRGIEIPETPDSLPPGTPLVDRNPQNPQTLPDYARPWTPPPTAKVAVTTASTRATTQPPPAHTPAKLIELTHQGVEALQILIEPPEAPTKTDTIVELLESLDSRTFRMEQRQEMIELMLIAVLRHLNLPTPGPRKVGPASR